MEGLDLVAGFTQHARSIARYDGPVQMRSSLAGLVACLVLVGPSVGSLVPSAAAAPGSVGTNDVEPGTSAKAPECATFSVKGAGAPKSSLWAGAKQPSLKEHCLELQQGIRRFRNGEFLQSVALADRAELLSPGLAGPHVVRGEALARWGKYKEAHDAFEKARAIHPRALDDAEALDDLGFVQVRLGKLDEARKTYRALLPRVAGPLGLCAVGGECEAAGTAYLTAGMLALEQGKAAIDEAVAVLREARGKSPASSSVRRVATLALALALDRRGDVAQARELTTELAKTAGIPGELPTEISSRFPAVEEALAVRAIGLEATEPAAALEVWRKYLTAGGDKRAWADHAKQHVAALEKPAPKKKGG